MISHCIVLGTIAFSLQHGEIEADAHCRNKSQLILQVHCRFLKLKLEVNAAGR